VIGFLSLSLYILAYIGCEKALKSWKFAIHEKYNLNETLSWVKEIREFFSVECFPFLWTIIIQLHTKVVNGIDMLGCENKLVSNYRLELISFMQLSPERTVYRSAVLYSSSSIIIPTKTYLHSCEWCDLLLDLRVNKWI